MATRKTSVETLATDLAKLTETVAKTLSNKTDETAIKLAEKDLATQKAIAEEGHKIFGLIMNRFDKVDTDNKELHNAIEKHVEADEVIHKVVDKHSTYWALALKILLGVIAGTFAIILTYLKWRS